MKKALILLAAVLLLVGCSSTRTSDTNYLLPFAPIDYEEDVLNRQGEKPGRAEFPQEHIELLIGEEKKVEYRVLPTEADTSGLSVVSDNPEIATVQNGFIVGASEGTAVISVVYEGKELGHCTVTVKPVVPERLWLDSATVEGKIGRSVELQIHSEPEFLTDPNFTVTVSDENVAVYEDGVLRCIEEGTAEIVVTHDASGFTASFPLTVAPVEAESIEIIANDKVTVGDQLSVSVAYVPEDTTDQQVTWEISDPEAATIKDGVVQTQKIGTVTVIAKTASGIIAEKEIEILPVYPKYITLHAEKNTLDVGETININAEISPENTTDKTIVWTSSDETIATVNEDGQVNTVNPGHVDITATLSNGVKGTYSITINPKPVSVKNGFIKKPSGKKTAPVKIHAPLTNSCYVYFKHDKDSRNDFSVYVEANTTVNVKAPLGTYELYYATGETWYGAEYLFGFGTNYYKTDSIIKMYTSGKYVYGLELTLYGVVDGNMKSEPIDSSDFPG